jgi:hypothetical protein
MSKKINKVTGDLSTVVSAIEARVTVIEKQVKQLVSQRVKVRKARLFTGEQKAAIRARLLEGQEAARKKREAEAKSAKKANNHIKTAEAVKPTEN